MSLERRVNSLGVRCLYCGSGTVWWDCSCEPAREAVEGKRPKPKILLREGRVVIVLDEEAAAFNALGLERFKPLPPQIAAAKDAVDAQVEAIVRPDRKEYRREWMRQFREKHGRKPKPE